MIGGLLYAGLARAADSLPQFMVVDYHLVSKVATGTATGGQPLYDHTYRVDVRNAGAAAVDVAGTARSRLSSVFLSDQAASFGAVGAHQTKASTDTITVRAGKYFDRRLDKKVLRNGRWSYEAEGRDEDDDQIPGLPPNIPDWANGIVDWFYDIKFQFLFQWSFTVRGDKSAPVISKLLPQQGQADARPTISASFQDDAGDRAINTDAIRLSVDGVDVSAKAKSGSDSISYRPAKALSEGVHSVTLSVPDKSGNTGTASWSFLVDTLAPVVSAPAPKDLKNASPGAVISASYSDQGGSGIDTAKGSLMLDRNDVTADAVRTASGINYSPLKKLADGVHRVVLKLQDSVGNSTVEEWTFGVDSRGVTISQLAPAAGTVLAADFRPVIRASFTGVGTTVVPAKTVLMLDGKNVSAQAAISTSGITYTAPDVLAEGLHRVLLSVTDKLGYVSESSWTFITRSEPDITDVAPKDVTLNAQSVAAISAHYRDIGAGIDPALVKLLLDGVDVTALAQVTASDLRLTPAAPLPQGVHVATLTVTDKAGNSSTTTWRFTLDSGLPVISLHQPRDSLTGPSPRISASYQDSATTGTGIDSSKVRLFLDQADVTAKAQVGAGEISYSPAVPLRSGLHTVRLSVADVAGNQVDSIWSFTVDADGPVIAGVSPPQGGIVAADVPPAIGANFQDSGGGIDTAKIVLEVDGRDITGMAQVTATGIAYVPAQAFSEGEHQARVVATDRMGNTSSQVWSFMVASPPVISGQVPFNIYVAGGSTPEIGASYRDIGAGVDVAKVSLRVDGAEVSGQAAVSATAIRYSMPGPIADGTHEVVLAVTDLAGNRTESRWSFAALTPPSITSVSPTGLLMTGTPHAISATYLDPAGPLDPALVRLLLNGIDITSQAHIGPAGLTYAPTQPLAAGSYSVYLQVVNAGGGLANRSWSFDVDQEKTYRVEITSPAGPMSVMNSQLEVTAIAAASKTYPVRVSVNGKEMQAVGPNADGSVTYSGTADLRDGLNMLAFSATFADGGQAQANTEVDFDAPAIVAITSPQDRAVLGRVNDSSPADLTGNVERPVLVTGRSSKPLQGVTVNQQQAALSSDGLQFSFANFFLHEGSNVLTALATDRRGRTSSAAITVSVDQTAPLLNIEYPRNGHTTRAAWIDVRGMVNDAVEAVYGAPEPQVTVNGVNALVADRYFHLAEVPLKRGVNELLVKSTDHLGNAREQRVTVLRVDQGLAGLVMASGDNQTAAANTGLPVPFGVLALNERGEPQADLIVTFHVLRGSGSLSAASAAGSGAPLRRPDQQLQVTTGKDGRAQAWFKTGIQAGPAANAVRASAFGSPEDILFTATSTRGAPARIHAEAGLNQIGETGAPVMETLSAIVRDADNNPLPGVAVQFRVEEGDARFDADGGAIGDDGATIVVLSDKNGLAAARPRLGHSAGVIRVVAAAAPAAGASFSDAGAVQGAGYVIRAKAALDGPASFRGMLYNDKGTPLGGARVSVGRTALSATTADDGSFVMNDVPPGRIDLFIDGRTINPSNDPARPQYPSLHFEAFVVKGQVNELPHPTYLPPLMTGTAKTVGGDEDVILTIPGLEGFQMKVKAHSVTFPDGSRVGTLVVSPVAGDRLPMAPPGGAAQFGVPAWTVQPAGTRFDPPIEIQMPNATAELPGANLPVVQWDHDLGQFVPMGRATVGADGAFLVTDPGCGLTKAGWGGLVRSDNCRTAIPKGCPDCMSLSSTACPTCKKDPAKNKQMCNGDECKICKDGNCVRKPDEEKGNVEQKMDLQVFSRYMDGISAKLEATVKFGPLGLWVSSLELSRPTLTGALTETLLERCCQGKPTKAVKLSGTIEFSPGAISARVRPPTWRIPDPFNPTKDLAGVGLLIEARVSMSGTGSGVKADCDCSYAAFVGGTLRVTLAAYLDLSSPGSTMSGAPLPGGSSPRLLDVQGGVTVAGKAGAKLDCNGFTPSAYQLGPFELVAKLKAGDFIEKSVKIPLDWGVISGP